MPHVEEAEQGLLGDGTDCERLLSDLKSEVADIIAKQPIEKPRSTCYQFFTNITHKAVGGQQLTGNNILFVLKLYAG